MGTSLIFPRLIEFTERFASANTIRQRVAECATGHVLELTPPTGSNPWHYPRSITSLTTIVSTRGTRTKLPRRIRGMPFPVDVRAGALTQLPVKDHAFDCVVSTFTLGTLPDIGPGLIEIKRVLKPGGRLLFAEYGLSREPSLVTWQQRLRRLHQLLSGTNAPLDYVDEQLTAAGFSLKSCECSHLARIPRAIGWVYEGIAAFE